METKDTSFKTVFLINLVVYSPIKPVNKLKEANLTIAPSAEDYVTFLCAVFATHGKTEYKVTEKKTYGFKYIYPVSKPQKDAIDVNNAADFKAMKRLLVTEPCTISWVRIGRIDHRVPRTKGLD
ncbi:hypothetical protein BDR04DRAFT_1091685 [Suillus decipiens]|nr:hypothetical protein BDR04DRAFT_1091685 [Suillus decipiens]